MKKLLLLIPMLLVGSLHAQEKVEITYSQFAEITDPNIFTVESSSGSGRVSNPDMQKRIIDQFKTPTYSTLTVYNNESLYKPIEKLDNNQTDGFSVRVSFGSGDGTYYNIAENYYLENAELNNKAITIKDTPKTDWIMTRETKKFLGYNVRKAIRKTENGGEIVAWYTTDINMKTGPDKYVGLPGLVLEVIMPFGKPDVDNKRYIQATEVKILEDTKAIEKPKVEKNTMTQDEFAEESKKQFEKMKEMWGQGVDKKD